jgi:hypothetical protein
MQMDVQIRRNTEGISNPETPNALGNLLQMMARVAHLASTSTIAVSDERYRHGYLHGKLGRKKKAKAAILRDACRCEIQEIYKSKKRCNYAKTDSTAHETGGRQR